MARKDALLRLHARLVARRDALRKALSGDLDSLREYQRTFVVGDNADAAVDSAHDEISTQLAELESRELEQIERALQRIVKGVYGKCEFCGGKIAEARLNALPYTNSCIDCQRENERNGYQRSSTYDANRWAKLDDRRLAEDSDADHDINLNDFEMDLSESGR
ncbi:MAG: TraR/DksA C4-type zinc finger protein [Isosphaeraceae bacterium]|nr:TraR/DksA C4-type zinc finger protein [Isosphaeraceae bacterium]